MQGAYEEVQEEVKETLSDIYARQDAYGCADPAWYEKMVHKVPDAPSVDRVEYCCARLKDKVVLSIGCTGRMQDAVDSVAAKVYGVDIQPCSRENFWLLNLDRHPDRLPDLPDVQMVFAGETIEHLSNPGNVLLHLRKYNCPLLITVPNAFNAGARGRIDKGTEIVNPDHVAWYSYWTLMTLLVRYGYKIKEFAWYNGPPLISEGLIILAEV